MKIWNWGRFIISCMVCFGVLLMIFSAAVDVSLWPAALVLALIGAAGFTIVKGLLKRISDLEYRAGLQEHRIRELEKKVEDK